MNILLKPSNTYHLPRSLKYKITLKRSKSFELGPSRVERYDWREKTQKVLSLTSIDFLDLSQMGFPA